MAFSFPVNLNLYGKKCLVVGGGNVAERKVKNLLDSGAEVYVVSPIFTEWLENASANGLISAYKRCYETADLDGVFLVIGATDDCDINNKIADDCNQRNLLVNIVDSPGRCNFIVPAILRRGSLTVSVSTDGRSPMLARKIRDELDALFGSEYAEFLDLLGLVREYVLKNVLCEETRRDIFYKLVHSDIPDLLKDGKHEIVKERIGHVLGSGWTQS